MNMSPQAVYKASFVLIALSLVVGYMEGINMISALLPAFGLSLFAIGMILPGATLSWYIAIRTPWTLASEQVWERTHKLGGWVCKILGVLAICASLFPGLVVQMFVAPFIVGMMVLVAYSYLTYRRDHNPTLAISQTR